MGSSRWPALTTDGDVQNRRPLGAGSSPHGLSAHDVSPRGRRTEVPFCLPAVCQGLNSASRGCLRSLAHRPLSPKPATLSSISY